MLAQQLAPLLTRQQVPLGRAHERVDAEEGLGRRALHERGLMIGRELGGLDGAHERPREIHEPPRTGAPELHQEPLQLLRRVPDEPEHQVGVGAETDRRVRAAHVDPAFPRLVEVLDLLGGIAEIVGRRELVAKVR